MKLGKKNGHANAVRSGKSCFESAWKKYDM